jgi:hypothetical protein
MKKHLFILFSLIVGFTNGQNLGWFKQFETNANAIIIDHAVSTNTIGEIITCGLANSNNSLGNIDFDPSAATQTLSGSPAIYNVWVNKLDANGNYLWAKLFNVNNNGNGKTVAKINSLGEVVVGARFLNSSDFDPGAGTFTMTTNTNANGFFAKLNSNGSFAWAKQFQQLSGAAQAFVGDIEIDNLNNIFVSGYYSGTIDFDPSPTATVSLTNSMPTGFLAKFDNAGNFVWVKSLEGSAVISKPTASFLDKNKNVLITGTFKGLVDFDPSAASYTLNAQNTEAFVLKLDSNGMFIWAKQFADGISFHNVFIPPAADIITDSNNDVYITGATKDSLDFDPGAASYYLKSKGAEDVYVVKLTTSGNFVWAKMFGGTGTDISSSLVVDNSNDVYISTDFETSYAVDFDPGIGVSTYTAYASPSIAVNRLTTNGIYVGTYYFKSNSTDATNIGCLTMDNSNNLLVHGNFDIQNTAGFEWVDFDPGSAVFMAYATFGTADGFLVKLNNLTTETIKNNITNNSFILFPNPSDGNIILSMGDFQNSYFEVYDLIGRKVFSTYINSQNTQLDLNIVGGVYNASILDDKGNRVTKKLIIKE